MNICTDEMTGLVVSTAISIIVPYLVYALERYLKIRFDAAARETLDSAMLNGADWMIREGRALACLDGHEPARPAWAEGARMRQSRVMSLVDPVRVVGYPADRFRRVPLSGWKRGAMHTGA